MNQHKVFNLTVRIEAGTAMIVNGMYATALHLTAESAL